MIISVQEYLNKIDSRLIDGLIGIGIAVLTALAFSFGQDDSAKYIDPQIRWYLLTFVSCATQGLHALSKFREMPKAPPSSTVSTTVATTVTPPAP